MKKYKFEKSAVVNALNAVISYCELSTADGIGNLAKVMDERKRDGSVFDNIIGGESIFDAVFSDVNTIRSYMFYGYPNVLSIAFPYATTIEKKAFYECDKDVILSISNVKVIESEAFAYCTNMTKIDLPLVNKIGHAAFYSCNSLISVTMPDLKSIEASAFALCSSLKTADFCSKLIEIPASAFYSCTNLEQVDLRNASCIGSGAFFYCRSLSALSINKCSLIDVNAFMSCGNLLSVNGPVLRRILNTAFGQCSSISLISLPKIEYMYSSAFYGCRAMEKAYILTSDIPSIDANVFYNTPMYNSTYLGHFGSIYVRASLIESFASAIGWSVYSQRLVAYD